MLIAGNGSRIIIYVSNYVQLNQMQMPGESKISTNNVKPVFCCLHSSDSVKLVTVVRVTYQLGNKI